LSLPSASALLLSVTAAILACGLSPAVAWLSVALGAIDSPGGRKIHMRPTPRLGGVAIVVALGACVAAADWRAGWLLPHEFVRAVAAGFLPIAVTSLLDDLRGVRPVYRLAAHFIGASIAVRLGIGLSADVHLFGGDLYIGYISAPASILWLVVVTNAFNIVDGLDGLSVGLALISSASMTIVFALLGDPRMAAMALVLAGTLIGFRPYNTYPARIFLGETGAAAIGFHLGALTLRAGSVAGSGLGLLLPVFVVALPLAEIVVTVLRRLIRWFGTASGGPFTADRDHIHHRLLGKGLGHATAVRILHVAGLVGATIGVISMFLSGRTAAVVVVTFVVVIGVALRSLGYGDLSGARRATGLYVTRASRSHIGAIPTFRRVRDRATD
jgi:UDP-GlcNAc:undecaprenyl-phosphate/decaprenyl-phosphate GlcNAc-1-phosphate transferase